MAEWGEAFSKVRRNDDASFLLYTFSSFFRVAAPLRASVPVKPRHCIYTFFPLRPINNPNSFMYAALILLASDFDIHSQFPGT